METPNGKGTKAATAEVVDGSAIAADITRQLIGQVRNLSLKYSKVPGLAFLLVGERRESQTYVRIKRIACEEVGMRSFTRELPSSVSQAGVIKAIREFNENTDVHGIVVELPLPSHINEQAVLQEIDPEKDVDCCTPSNIGCLGMKGRQAHHLPSTPKACLEVLKRTGCSVEGKRTVVVGRTNSVGRPLAQLLTSQDATCTICHSRTPDLASYIKDADIVLACADVANLIKGAWIKKGAVVIDIGTNPVEDPSQPTGYKVVGDVEFEAAKERASAITSVPGVSLVSIALLMENTVTSASKQTAESVLIRSSRQRRKRKARQEGLKNTALYGTAVFLAVMAVKVFGGKKLEQDLAKLSDLPVITLDGTKVRVLEKK